MPRKSKKNEPLREAKVVETPEEFENNTDIADIEDDSMLLPNDGFEFKEELDEETKEEITEDQLMFSTSPIIVDALFDWLEAEILATDSVEATLALADTRGLSKESALEAMAFVRVIFEAKKVNLQNIRDTLNRERSK